MRVQGERAGDAAPQRAVQHEVEGAKGWQLEPFDPGEAERLEEPGDSRRCQGLGQKGIVLGPIGDDGDHRYVALVAGPRMSEVMKTRRHATSMSIRGLMRSRGNRVDAMATTALADRVTPPPPAGPLV